MAKQATQHRMEQERRTEGAAKATEGGQVVSLLRLAFPSVSLRPTRIFAHQLVRARARKEKAGK